MGKEDAKMRVEDTLKQIIEYLAQFSPYIEEFVVDCKEKEYAIQKINEAVFWLTYLIEEFESE